MDVITCHLNADFDALASMAAAKKYYPDATLVFSGSQEKSVRDFLSSPHVALEFRKVREINLDDVTRLILVDVRNPERIGRFYFELIFDRHVKVIYVMGFEIINISKLGVYYAVCSDESSSSTQLIFIL